MVMVVTSTLQVVLVGGMSNTTFLSQKIKSVFSSSEVLCHIDPSHTISIGNALQVGIIAYLVVDEEYQTLNQHKL